METLQTTYGLGCTRHGAAAVGRGGWQEEWAAASQTGKGRGGMGKVHWRPEHRFQGDCALFLFLVNVPVWEQGRKVPVCEKPGVQGYRKRAPHDSSQAAWQPAPV